MLHYITWAFNQWMNPERQAPMFPTPVLFERVAMQPTARPMARLPVVGVKCKDRLELFGFFRGGLPWEAQRYTRIMAWDHPGGNFEKQSYVTPRLLIDPLA